MTASVARALPPEGFESFTLFGSGKTAPYLSGALTYQRPVYRDDYASLEVVKAFTNGSDLITVGARSMISPTIGDRDAYFLRYDLTVFQTSSLGLKLIHENWRYISSSKDSIGIDYNIYFGSPRLRSGVYVSLGGYYRYLKQRWNDPWWTPTNLNTQDQEGYALFVLGVQGSLGNSGSFFTFDINTRDHFSYYNMDNMAFDLALNLDSNHLLWQFIMGFRTTALTMGTASLSESYLSFGFLAY
jgi:hypothetical protein